MRHYEAFGLISLGICVLLLVFSSCQSEEMKVLPHTDEVSIRIHELAIETVPLDSEGTTQVGTIRIQGEEILFLDKVTQKLHRYDQSGIKKNIALGRGSDPFQVGALYHFIPFPDSPQYLVMDDFTIHHFANDSTKLQRVQLDIGFDPKNEAELLRNPDASNTAIYWPGFTGRYPNTNFSGIIGDYYYVPIITEHPLLNAYMHEAFYKESFAVGKFKIAENRLELMGVQWPEIYLQHKFVPNLAALSFSIFQHNIYLSFAIDPLIYIYDADFNALGTFGRAGDGMKASYRTTTTFEEAEESHSQDLGNQSIYGSVFADGPYVFRSYFPEGMEAAYARLQIFEDKVLIGDVKVAPRFNVIGRIGEYYYADGIVDEMAEQIAVFKFKLEK